MKWSKVIGVVVFFWFLLLNSLLLVAQDKRVNKIDKMAIAFKGNHIGFNFAMLSCKKARAHNQFGSNAITSKAAPGILLGLKYYINFSRKHSLVIGPEVMVAGRNFIMSINKNDFSPPLQDNYNLGYWNSLVPDLVFRFPVVIESRVHYKKRKYLFAGTGIALNYSTGADFYFAQIIVVDVNNNFYDAGGLNVNANNDQKPWMSYPVNLGHAWLLKNNNLLQLSICSNISFTKYVNGTYEINIPNKPLTVGNYSTTASYIGLSMNYVFTNANYRLRKLYEKN
jgi:hypothetical protein